MRGSQVQRHVEIAALSDPHPAGARATPPALPASGPMSIVVAPARANAPHVGSTAVSASRTGAPDAGHTRLPADTRENRHASGTPAYVVAIIDDNPEDRALMREYLARDQTHQFVFREASTGAQGAAICREMPVPDCVLLDLRLPDMDGLEVICQMQDDNCEVRYPIIVVTGVRTSAGLADEEGLSALRMGAQDFVGKGSITAESLSRAVINAMERFRLTQRVKRSEQYFRTLFESDGVAHAETDANTGYFIRVNKRFCELTGYGADELASLTYLQLTHPDDHPRNLLARARALESGEPTEMEKRYVCKDGSIKWVHATASPVRNENGRISSFIGGVFDITESKVDETALRHRINQLRLFTMHAPAAIAMLDRDLRYVGYSEQWLADYGLNGQKLRGRKHYDVFPDIPARWREVHQRCLAGAVERAEEDHFRDSKGNSIWLRWEIHPYRNATGEIDGIVIYSENISERKEAELALKNSERRLRLATAATRAMVFDLDVASMRLNSVDGVEDLLGVKMTAVELTMPWWESRILPQDLDKRRKAFEAMRQQPQPQSMEYRMRHESGRTIWVADNVTPVLDDAGALVRVVGTVVDITVRKQAEEALREADRSKDDFIATLAHELRNPLAPVSNATQVMNQLNLADPTFLWCRGVIERQVSQMARLLDDLLDISRINNGKLSLHLAPVDLATVIEHAREMARPGLDASSHELSIQLPDSRLLMRGDSVRLIQIFTNLLTNAAKYTPAHGHIRLCARKIDGNACIDVIDDGIGIDAADHARVFRMFSQIETARDRSQGGLGIGLALVKALVELHGGTVEAHSEGLGKGSRFRVSLPLLAQQSLPNGAEPTHNLENGVHRRILVVDDNRDSAESLCMLLRMLGNEVEAVFDGDEALSRAQQLRPDIVLLDLGLPRMDGHDVARALRLEPWAEKTTIVAVTGRGQEEDRRRTHEAGFDFHLVKPLDHARLMEIIGKTTVSKRP